MDSLARNVLTPAATAFGFLAFHPAVGAPLTATLAALLCALLYVRLDPHVVAAAAILGGLALAAVYVGNDHNGPLLALILASGVLLGGVSRTAR